jgi:hypothetical protein
MKTPLYLILALFAAIVAISGCTKDGKLNAPTGQIAADRIKLKINQPDFFALVGADSTKVVNWGVTPAGFDTLATQRNAARIVFTKAGNYTVSANQTGGSSATIGITVIDSVWVPPSPYIAFDGTEQINFVPQYVKSATSDSSYIAFTATTKKTYCTRTSMDYGIYYDVQTTSYYVQFNGASLGANDCGIGSSILSVHNDLTYYEPKLTEGHFPLHIFFNGKIHDGSIDVTATTITFNWDDSVGVVINPKQLTR